MYRYNEGEVTCGIQHIANTSVNAVLGGPWRTEQMKDCVLDANVVLRYLRVVEAEGGDQVLALFEHAEREQRPANVDTRFWCWSRAARPIIS